MRARQYTTAVLFMTVTLAATIAAANWWIDPFAIWHPERGSQPVDRGHGRMTKIHWIASADADLLVLGNSHANGGFSAASFKRLGLAKRPFNGSYPGAQIYSMRRSFQHYAQVSKLKTAVVVLDILNFFDERTAVGGFEEDRLAVTADGDRNRLWWLGDAVRTTLTWSAIGSSFEAVSAPPRRNNPKNGFRPCTPAAVPHEAKSVIAMLPARYKRFRDNTFLDETGESDWQAEVARLFETARKHHIKLYVVIPPAHVAYYIALEETGYWEEYLTLVRKLSELASEAGGDIEVFDFTGFTKIQTEDLLSAPTSTYWADTDHFQCHTGDIIVARLAGKLEKFPGFGRRVVPEQAEAHTARIETEKAAWIAVNPEAYCAYRARLSRAAPSVGCPDAVRSGKDATGS